MRRIAPTAFGVLLPAAALAQEQASVQVQAPAQEQASVQATAEAPPKKKWSVNASSQYRQLAVSDPDPANDRVLLWTLGGSVEAFPGGKVFARFGLQERFVAEQGESGWKFRDSALGLSYNTPISLGNERELGLGHKLTFTLPTSRASSKQDLYFATGYSLTASYEIVHGLSLAVIPDARHRWHQYAERAGYDGVMNIQWEVGLHAGLDWTFLESERFGSLTVGASTGSGWQRKYASRDDHESSTADAAVWQQSYDWEAHLGYDPIPHLSLGASLEHGGSVLRDGIVNTFFVHRDETELVFSLSGNY
jgi:hypothetical protein